jgi:hypothetical protein
LAANVKKNFSGVKFRLWSAGFQHGMMLKQASKRRAGGWRSGPAGSIRADYPG